MAYEPIIESSSSFEDEHDDDNIIIDDREDAIDHDRRPPTDYYSNRYDFQNWKLILSFWILGLLNNSSYVIMIACAKNISEGYTGLVFLANVVPSLAVKATAPYWFHAVSYDKRLTIATISMSLSFLLVAMASSSSNNNNNSGNDTTTTTTITNDNHLFMTYKLSFQLLGVAFGSIQAGLGEASLLALAGKTDGAASASTFATKSRRQQSSSISSSNNNNNNHNNTTTTTTSNNNNKSNNKGQCLTSFSSGTGMAGVFGFFWKWLWNDFLGLSLSTTLFLALTLSIGYISTFRYAMKHQPSSLSLSSDDNDHRSFQDRNNNKLHAIETELSPITTSINSNNMDEEEETTITSTSSTTMLQSETLALNVNSASIPSQQQSQLTMQQQQQQQQLVVGYDTNLENDDDNNIDLMTTTTNNVILEIDEMTGRQRFYLVLSLWPYMIPLFVVYAAEYALQAGTWSAMGFPIEDVQSRDKFYEYSNWMYQAGVFLSRSSGTLFTAPIWILWLMPALQTLNLIIFCIVAIHPMTSPLYTPGILYTGAFYTGLLGGAVYICGYKRICADLPLVHREFALSATSVAEGLGIVVADALGLVIQACLYHINGLDEATLSCPFV